MTKIVNVTPVEITDPQTGETMMVCSRPIIDPACLWTIFTMHYKGRMDLYQALIAVDGRRFDRKGPLSKTDINRARNVFRAIEKYGRQHNQPCVAVNGRQTAIDRQIMYLNKDKEATNDYWKKRASAASREAYKLPRGKTGIRLADIGVEEDVQTLLDEAAKSEQISDTYEVRADQLIAPLMRTQVLTQE